MKKSRTNNVSNALSPTLLRNLIPSILVGIVCLFILWEAQFSFSYFYGNDAYYHVRYAQTFTQRGISKTFPWTQFSIWKDHFSDKDFLYHLYLLLFCSNDGSLIKRGKIAALTLACGVFVVFFIIVLRNRLITPYIWPLLLLVSGPSFQHRLLSVRPQFFGVLISMLYVDSFINDRRKSLFLYCLLWPLLHSSYPLIPVLGGIILLSSLDRKKGIRLFTYSIVGMGLGVILNPYFPNNLYFFWVQGVLVLRNSSGLQSSMPKILGAELSPFPLSELLLFSTVTVMAFLLSLVGSVTTRLLSWKMDDKVKSYLLISSFFFISTLIWRRFIEYWIPFATLFAGFFLSQLLEREKVKQFYKKGSLMKLAAGMFLLLIIGLLLLQRIELEEHLKVCKTGRPSIVLPIFKSGAEWIKQNIEPGQTVFHPSWNEFSQLYCFDPSHFYIIGLDPSFFYYYDIDLFDLWYRIYQGEVSDVYESVRYKFNSNVIFLPKYQNSEILYGRLQKDNRILKKYEDPYCSIFQLTD